MKIKKLISLALCFLTLVSTFALTGCDKSKDSEEEEDSSKKVDLVTLNMFIVTDDSTTEHQKQAVEIAINELTIKDYKTKLNINYIKEDEYWDTIEQTLEDIEAYESENKKTTKKNKKTLSLDQLYTDMRENGINIDTPQIDIIVFNDYDKYVEYATENKLVALDSYLKTESKVLTSYIYPSYLEAAKLGGKNTYGIPVNGPIGTYEYIAIDRELAQKYIKNADMQVADAFESQEEYDEYFDNYIIENYNTFPKLASFLVAVSNGESDVVPLNKTTSPGNVEFYLEEGSPIGIVFEGTEWHDRLYSVYDNESVKEHFKAIYNYRQAGYIADENTPNDARYAVQIIEGSSTAEEAWEKADGRDYIFIPYKYPKLISEEVLSGVFAISAKSYNKDRAMEIIEAFNTKPALANLLQWGVNEKDATYSYTDENGVIVELGGSYTLEDDGTVILIDNGNGYVMDNNLTGNKYIKYRLNGTPDEFEGQKIQNTESWVGAFSGYNPVYNAEDEEANEKVKAEILSTIEIAKEYYPDFLAGTGDRPFEERYNELLERLGDTNPLLAFDTHVWYNYSGPYVSFVTTMKESYPYGRKSGLEAPIDEEDNSEENDTEIIEENPEESSAENNATEENTDVSNSDNSINTEVQE